MTGDSGAGKTETVKHILQYITLVSKSRDAKIASKLLQVKNCFIFFAHKFYYSNRQVAQWICKR